MDEKSTILVTGAAGFIAFHVISKLLKDGHSVVGIDNFDPFYSREQKERNLRDLPPFTFIEKDICDLTEKDFPENCSAVIHLAAKAGIRPSLQQPEDYFKTNVVGTVHLLELCKNLKIKNILFGSSSSVYGDASPAPFSEDFAADFPISPYAATKRAGELVCHTYSHLYGLTIAALRFFTVYGPRQRPDLAIHKFSKLLMENKTITLFGDGSTRRDYTFVDDIVTGIMSALDWTQKSDPGQCEIFNLGGSQTTSLLDLVRHLESASGNKAQLHFEKHQPGDVQLTYADISKSEKILGYSPKTPISEGIVKFMAWMKEEYQ